MIIIQRHCIAVSIRQVKNSIHYCVGFQSQLCQVRNKAHKTMCPNIQSRSFPTRRPSQLGNNHFDGDDQYNFGRVKSTSPIWWLVLWKVFIAVYNVYIHCRYLNHEVDTGDFKRSTALQKPSKSGILSYLGSSMGLWKRRFDTKHVGTLIMLWNFPHLTSTYFTVRILLRFINRPQILKPVVANEYWHLTIFEPCSR